MATHQKSRPQLISMPGLMPNRIFDPRGKMWLPVDQIWNFKLPQTPLLMWANSDRNMSQKGP